MTSTLTLAYVLIAVGLLLLLAELFIPSGGLLFVLSVLALVVGITMTFLYSDDPSTGILTLLGVFVILPAGGGFLLHYMPKTRLGKRYFMAGPDGDETVAALPENQELEQLKGRFGRTVTALRPAGITDFDGRHVDTISEGLMIEPGQMVRCID